MTKQRLWRAFACYAVLAVVAALTLKGEFLIIVLIVLAALALKSWIAYAKEKLE